jgi:hypothetical protein
MAAGNVMSGGVTALVVDYVALRRHLGYRSPSQERALRAFARYWTRPGTRGRSRWRRAWTGRRRRARRTRATRHGG